MLAIKAPGELGQHRSQGQTAAADRAPWFPLDNSQTPATTEGHLIKTPLERYRKYDKLSQVRVHQMGLTD